MVQRIQTIYLLFACILTTFIFKLVFVETTVSNETPVFNSLPLTIFIGVIILLHFVIIGMYKKRIRQVRVTVFTIILLLVLSGLFFYFTYIGIGGTKVEFIIPAILALATIILDFLAIYSIKKDEELIRSLNRIR